MMETQQIEFTLPGRVFHLEVVKNLEELITDPCDPDQIPCWADIWPAARALASYIWDHLDWQGVTVLELGAGLGLPGLVAAARGARVTLSDYQPQALELARRNAEHNHLSGLDYLLADWRSFPPVSPFHRILCSDVTYDPRLNHYLLEVIGRCLAPGGEVLVAHPGRPDTYDFLHHWQARAGGRYEETVIPVDIDDPYFPHYEIIIHRWHHDR